MTMLRALSPAQSRLRELPPSTEMVRALLASIFLAPMPSRDGVREIFRWEDRKAVDPHLKRPSSSG